MYYKKITKNENIISYKYSNGEIIQEPIKSENKKEHKDEAEEDLLNSIILSPSDDLNNLNFTEGSYIISYKFYERRK